MSRLSGVIGAVTSGLILCGPVQASEFRRAVDTLYTTKYGKARYVLTNKEVVGLRYDIIVMSKDVEEPLDPSLWRTNLNAAPDQDFVRLRPGNSKEFQVQLRTPGKFWVCAVRNRAAVAVRNCIPLISTYQGGDQ